MPPAPAAPPVAPAKPATPSSPAAPPVKSAAPAPTPEDAFAEIDRLSTEGDSDAKPTKPTKPAEKKETKAAEPTEPTKPDTTAGKPSDVKDKAPVPDEPSKEEIAKLVEAGKPLTTPELRHRLAQVQFENATLKKKIEANGTPKDDPEKTALTAKLTDAEKKLGEVEKEIKYANYEKSEEYQKEFVDPMSAAFKSAYADIAQLTIEDEDGSTRPATENDFGMLMRMELKQAISQAKDWFGDAASEILAHRRGLIQLNQRRQGAIEKFRAEAGERDKTRLADSARQREQMDKAWKSINKDIEEAHPELYQEDEADPGGNKELAEGKTLVARSMSRELPIEEVMKARALVLKNAEAFPRLLQRNNKLAARVKELEAELAQFKNSEPGAGDGDRQPEGGAPESWEAEIDRMAAGRG